MRLRPWSLCLFITVILTGCGRPDAANIELRKQVQQLQSQLDQARLAEHGEHAQLLAMQQRWPTTQSLSLDTLDQLFLPCGLQFGRLTGGSHWDTPGPADQGIEVYVVPVDADGDVLKAAGSFNVEAFDLGEPKQPAIGTWNFPTDQARKMFLGKAFMYTYVLRCPWQTLPKHKDLTVRVSFTDALTGRQFTEQKQVTATLP